MRYIITSAQKNAGVNKNLLQNIQRFAREHKVDYIHVIPMAGRYKEEEKFAPEISELEFVDKLKLNNNLIVYDTKILPQQIDPFRGMASKLSRDYSYILPSPKIRYKSIANNSKYPRALMSTGSLTRPNYKTWQAHGKKAQEQHQYGFVYVEVVDKTIFQAHQIEATTLGDFHYLTERYYGGKLSHVQPEALVLGDWHTGDTCPKVRKKTFEMLKELKPKRVVFHDIFNGHSINHHERGDLLAELRLIEDKRVGLKQEATQVFNELKLFAEMFPKIEFFVVRSNHDDFLEKYICGKKFIDDPHNFLFTCSVIPKIVNDKAVPLKEMLSLIGELPTNVRFFQQDESYRVRGVELAEHGHLGVNGSRGTPRQYSGHNLRMITGHTHTPELNENGMTVGTSTKLRLSYTHGASSWLNAHGILYPNGKYALITLIL